MAGNVANFSEWHQDRIRKSTTPGGTRSPISPTGGLMGRQGGFRPGPGYGGGDINQYSGGNRNNKYDDERPIQPLPWIDDVNMEQNWYSPFQPIWPFGPPYVTRPREWDYPTGYNLNFIQPRLQAMRMFRAMRDSWGVLATVVATRQDQLLRIPSTIQRKDRPGRSSVGVDMLKQFFKKPDGKLRFQQWARLILDDLLVLDAPCIYFSRDRAGRPIYAERLDPLMIFPLIDDAGRRPDSVVEVNKDGLTYERRQPAFQQIVKGMAMIDLDESEILYAPMRPNPSMPMFGFPATEQILNESIEAILKTMYQKDFWKEGNIPDLVVTVPENWSPRHIAMFQAHFDATFSGDLAAKSKVRFLPGGMKPFDIKNSSGESLWSQRDETLIRLVCYAYSVSPAPFIKMLNRSTAQNAQQMAEEEGLYPLMSFWKECIMDPIIQEAFGMDDIEFVYLPRPEPDAEKQAKIHQIQVKTGIRTVNEVRGELGQEPVPGGDVIMIELGNSIVPLEDAAEGGALPSMNGGGSGVPSTSPTKVPSSSDRGSNPQRGGAKPTTGPSEVKKTFESELLELLLKTATPDQLQAAISQASGNLDDQTHLQLHTGNYRKGHVYIQGLNISIENAPGSTRGEKDQSGKKWSVRMPSAYGYIRGTIGADGDQVDVYLGKNPDAKTVWVIDQDKVSNKGKVQGFDEHKCMIGYDDLETALTDYLLTHFDGHGHDRLDTVTELSMQEFKSWLSEGDTKEPIKDQDFGRAVVRRKHLAKDITQASGFLNYDLGPKAPKKLKPKKRLRRRHEVSGSRWQL